MSETKSVRPAVKLLRYDPQWPAKFSVERARLHTVLGAETPIEHIGSTSIEGLEAKPIIDILVGSGSSRDEARILGLLLGLGYVEEGARPGHRWLCWPAPEHRTFIIHLVPFAGDIWHARLTFRDRLRQFPELRRAYADLKRGLAKTHADDLNAYTAAKFSFVHGVVINAASGTK